ncbi:hypothetical protein JCM10207_003719 [Rhodosporidiobolus poonsookiae]
MTTDRLTALPVELLEHICHLVHDLDPTLYLGRVSSAFVPLARQLVFRKVRTSGSGELSRLCEIVEGADEVGAAVKKLAVWCNDRCWPDDAAELPDARFSDLLARLPGLIVLSIVGTGRLVEVFLQPETAKFCQTLEHLHIVDPLRQWANPFDPAYWSALRHCPQLYTLELDINRDGRSLALHTQEVVPPRIESPFLWDISLRGSLIGSFYATPLLLMLPPCHSLTLTDTNPHGAWNTILQMPDLLDDLPSPECLETLDVEARADPSVPIRNIWDETLLRFPNLSDLSLGPCTYKPASFSRLAFPPALKALTLYGHTPNLAARDIKPLLSDPTRLPALESFTLDTIRVRDGGEFHAEGPVPGVPVVYWTEDFSHGDMEEIVKIARERGVQLDGDAVWIVQDGEEWLQYDAEFEFTDF